MTAAATRGFIGVGVKYHECLGDTPAPHIAKAVYLYRDCLTDASTFAAWTLEDVVAAIRSAGAAGWIDGFHERYLAFEKIEALAARPPRLR